MLPAGTTGLLRKKRAQQQLQGSLVQVQEQAEALRTSPQGRLDQGAPLQSGQDSATTTSTVRLQSEQCLLPLKAL